LVVVGAGASDCDALEVDCSNGRRSFDAADGWTGGTELADEVDRGTIAQTATAPAKSAAIATVASCHLVSAGLSGGGVFAFSGAEASVSSTTDAESGVVAEGLSFGEPAVRVMIPIPVWCDGWRKRLATVCQ